MSGKTKPTDLPDFETADLCHSAKACAWPEALAAWKDHLNGGHAIVHTKDHARFARIENGALVYARYKAGDEAVDEAVTDGAIFEARAFNDTVELRWRKAAPGAGGTADIPLNPPSKGDFSEALGEAVALYEDGAVSPPGDWSVDESPLRTHTLDGRYLVLGNPVKPDKDADGPNRAKGTTYSVENGWTRVKDFRVKDFHIPHTGAFDANNRPAIAYREYFTEDPKHGNLQFLAERLTGLEPLV